MPRLTINGQGVEVPSGSTVLQAAQQAGVYIPTLCHVKGLDPFASCFACAVEVAGAGKLLPACAAPASEGMVVVTDSPAAQTAQRRAVELLLSDHLGECQAPCELACPAHWEIAECMALVREGELERASGLARRALVLPGVLGYVCPAPCQKACRRTETGEAVAIRELHKFLSEKPTLPSAAAVSSTGKKVAIVGAGPAGLAAGVALAAQGHACTLFDQNAQAGGTLLSLGEGELPRAVLQRDVDAVAGAGVEFRLGTKLGQDISLEQLGQEYDAVVVAMGEGGGDAASCDNAKGLFACGAMVGQGKLAIRAIASGLAAAVSVGQYLAGQAVTGPARPLNLRYGPLEDQEREMLWARATNASPSASKAVSEASAAGLEAQRCLLCGCRENRQCRLRALATQLGCKASGFTGERRPMAFDASHPCITYESHKCILCGACVEVARQAGEELAMVGRGFATRISAPIDAPLASVLSEATALRCAEVCPTSAMTRKNNQAGQDAPATSKGLR